ncbi:hypothetical protein L6R52_41490 [Myxococcota bacterium]|nr:hypothetical protein [Myxococcota bacterium]
MQARAIEETTEERWVPVEPLGRALHQADRWLRMRGLTSREALQHQAALGLARQRGESQVPAAKRILDYLGTLGAKRPEALLRSLQEGLDAQRAHEAAAPKCGDCGATVRPEVARRVTACPYCGASKRPHLV